MGGCSTCKRQNYYPHKSYSSKKSSCGCCNNRKQISRPCNRRNCSGQKCYDCDYCNTCLNCRCHDYPGHFMSVKKFACRNSCKRINYTFEIPNPCGYYY